ncbi:MAG: DegQ family serine endoprotease [Verrucomicrobiota bacterium]|nr:DegQ family serine endoprotease [Verrucomicrobiota bacterium]
MKRTFLNLTWVCVGAVATMMALQWVPIHAKSDKPLPRITVQDTPVARDGKFTTSFAPVIKRAAPSVVNISTSKKIPQNDMRLHPFFNDPMFRRYFGLDEEETPQPRNRREQSLGSGVIISEDGYIVTNNHVVEGGGEIKVELTDGRELDAKLVGNDPSTDTAVLKVEATGLPAVTIANSDNLQVGDVVLAIGNPFALGQTVTMGIVSATSRGNLGIMDYEDFIQTDASINPGNSGGALIDAEGRLVGINTAILSRTGGNQGVGFAVPVNMVRSVMERLIQFGKVTRGYLGVAIQPLPPQIVEFMGLPDGSGALVGGVSEGTPAAEAGIKAGDVIVEVNGKKITDNRHLRLMVSQTAPGTTVTVKALRETNAGSKKFKTETFKVKLGELPVDELAAIPGQQSPGKSESEALNGVEVTDLDAQGRRQFNIPRQIQGALVTQVEPNSGSYAAGLRPGDVILEINRQPVKNAEQAVELSTKVSSPRTLVRVFSRGAARYLLIDDAPAERQE